MIFSKELGNFFSYTFFLILFQYFHWVSSAKEKRRITSITSNLKDWPRNAHSQERSEKKMTE